MKFRSSHLSIVQVYRFIVGESFAIVASFYRKHTIYIVFGVILFHFYKLSSAELHEIPLIRLCRVIDAYGEIVVFRGLVIMDFFNKAGHKLTTRIALFPTLTLIKIMAIFLLRYDNQREYNKDTIPFLEFSPFYFSHFIYISLIPNTLLVFNIFNIFY